MIASLLDRQETFILMGIVLAIVAGTVLGLASLLLSPALVLVAIMALFLAPLLLKTPVPFILMMLVAYSTILSPDIVPLVPLGFGSLNYLDIALLGYIGLAVLRRIIEPDFELRLDGQSIAVITFIIALILSTALGIIEGTTVFNRATSEIRYFAYYLAFFVPAFWIQDRQQLKMLLYGFFILAVFVSIAMIAQYIVGDDVRIIYGRVEAFAQEGRQAEGVTRIIPSGRYLVLVSFITLTFMHALQEHGNRWITLAWAFTGMGVLLTFNRNFWVSASIVIALFFVVIDPASRRRLIHLLIKSGIVLCILLGAVLSQPESPAAQTVLSVGERFFSIFSPNTYQSEYRSDNNTSSLEFRRIENQYALTHLSPPPLLGLGAGAYYRPRLPRLDSVTDTTDVMRGYIHNGHFWVLLKTGVLGYVALMSMFGITIFRGLRYWTYFKDPTDKAIFMGFSLALLGLLLSAIVDPILSDLTWTPVCGVLVGVNAVYMRHYKKFNQEIPSSHNQEILPS